MKIATWNVNSLRVRLDHVKDWLMSAAPDVLGLQETKLTDDKFPTGEFEALGYQSVFSGQPTYNGVALISREPATEILTDLNGYTDPQRRVLAATINGMRVLNLYVPNGQSVGAEKYHYKLDWLAALTAQLRGDLKRYDQVVVMATSISLLQTRTYTTRRRGREEFFVARRNAPHCRVFWTSV